MRKTILFLMVVVMALALMGGLALAGGWTDINYSGAGNLTDADTWNPTLDGQPHGNFSSSTNKCRICHAVHLANDDSWRLLDDTSAATECDTCHGATGGVTNLRPYNDTSSSFTTRGEHSLSVSTVPDATNSSISPLVCNSCHSVHGANTLMDDSPFAYAVTTWDSKILRKDPNRDGVDLGTNATGSVGNVAGGLSDDANAVKTGFCADCHTKNPNWNLGADSNEDGTDRLNKSSHVQGPDANGTLAIQGVNTQVAGYGAVGEYTATTQTTSTGCMSCHNATSGGNRTTVDQSAFPHRSKGAKLLYDNYTEGDPTGGAADPTRALAQMDQVCGACHDDSGILGDETSDAAVGNTF